MDTDNLLEKCYSLFETTVGPLEGYDSINFKVVHKSGVFVLKQHQNTPEIVALLKAEAKILERLARLQAYDFPRNITSNSGETLVIDGDRVFQLLSYVEGHFLNKVTHDEPLLHAFGVFLGEMDKALEETYQTAIAAKETVWDLKHFKKSSALMVHIGNPRDRNLVDYFFLQFNEQVVPVAHQLRKGILHNDANDWNVLVQNGRVSGIIDFGDMCHTWVINELAVALTYVMMHKENPLAIAIPVIQGYHNTYPLEEHELDILYYLIAARLCTSVCNSAYSKKMKPDSDYIVLSEKPAWDLLRRWVAINPIEAGNTFKKAAGYPETRKPRANDQLKRRKALLSPALSLSYRSPIEMSRSAFQYMYDTEGNTILDAYNNIMLVGHCHPKVVRAGQRTLAKLNTNTRYLYEELLRYGESLLSLFPEKLSKVFFVNSGSAATDLAIRMAFTVTGKSKVMALEYGYHGNTHLGIDVSHYKYRGTGGKKDFVIKAPMPKVFASGFENGKEAGEQYAARTALLIEKNRGDIAAFIAEPIMGCGGQVPLAPGYLKQLYPKIREQGGICISDEVQVGFGRLGHHFWGFEMHGVIPDMVILGKPMGNGHPIGAVVTTEEIAHEFDNGLEFFSSFGGNPVSCAIGHAVLDVIYEEGLQQHAREVGDYLMALLTELGKTYPQIADVRGMGLFIGVELMDTDGKPLTKLASEIKNGLRELHILIGTDGPYDNVLKIKPPLIFGKSDSRKLVAHITSILKELIIL